MSSHDQGLNWPATATWYRCPHVTRAWIGQPLPHDIDVLTWPGLELASHCHVIKMSSRDQGLNWPATATWYRCPHVTRAWTGQPLPCYKDVLTWPGLELASHCPMIYMSSRNQGLNWPATATWYRCPHVTRLWIGQPLPRDIDVLTWPGFELASHCHML